uniref:Uncharacterized protein n=1 Tax=Myoviridae sp. ctoNH1 TaxID=2826695 RepID=A0A8S5QSP8_9CAUD|nr:MAG TPA: hypothetical protein [Myoviridae sp. ctoNH1]
MSLKIVVIYWPQKLMFIGTNESHNIDGIWIAIFILFQYD